MTTQEERDAIEWEESWARYDALTAKKKAVLNHTPGPWKEYAESGECWIQSVSDIDPTAEKVICETDTTSAADVELICAAPEMLACLRAADAAWQMSFVPPWVAEIRALLARLDAATPAE